VIEEEELEEMKLDKSKES